jgi:AcrR family transcriptional regulator
MQNKQPTRSERTKRNIIAAAAELFAERGFDVVTMREIARKAGCSHTAIYLYFADKEALLHHISMPPLLELKEQFSRILRQDKSPKDQLSDICLTWIRFCLTNRNMYEVFFSANAVRVDEAEPRLELNRVRNEMFGMLMQALQGCLPPGTDDERLLACARITFFMAHGIVGTYRYSREPVDELVARLLPTFRDAFNALLIGFGAMIEEGPLEPSKKDLEE